MKKFLLLVLLVCSIGSSYGQLTIVKQDSLSERAKEILNIGQTTIFDDARAPRFIITDKTQKFLFGVGGYVAGKGFYDFTGYDDTGLNVYDLTVPFNSKSPDKIGFGVSSSKLIFKLLGDTKLGILETTFELEFNSDYSMKLSKAYVRFGNFLIGQDWSVTTDTRTSPNVLDPADPVAKFGYQMPVIRYAFNPTERLRLYFSLEFPSLFYDYDGISYPISEFMPDFATKLMYTTKDKVYTGQFAAMVRFVKPDITEFNLAEQPIRHVAFGATTYHQVNLGAHTLYANASIGRGISDFFAGTSSFNYDLLGLDVTTQDRYFLPAWVWGGLGAYTVRWNDKAQSNLVASYLKVADWELRPNSSMLPDVTDELFSLSVNYMQTIIENMTIGGELLYGTKSIYSGAHGHGLRFGFLFRYDF